jgi:hypothetical protein
MSTRNYIAIRILLFCAEQVSDYGMKTEIGGLIRDLKEHLSKATKDESA